MTYADVNKDYEIKTIKDPMGNVQFVCNYEELKEKTKKYLKDKKTPLDERLYYFGVKDEQKEKQFNELYNKLLGDLDIMYFALAYLPYEDYTYCKREKDVYKEYVLVPKQFYKVLGINYNEYIEHLRLKEKYEDRK